MFVCFSVCSIFLPSVIFHRAAFVHREQLIQGSYVCIVLTVVWPHKLYHDFWKSETFYFALSETLDFLKK